jgi:hypothetical protein
VTASTLVTRLVHHVRAEHASTGRALAPLRASLEDAPPGWRITVQGADVVITARDGIAAPASPQFALITVADPLAALRLAEPTARVKLTAPALTHSFAPRPMTLTVELVTRPDGEPRPGATLTAHGTGASPVALPEVTSEPGLYRSATRVWTRAFHPLTLRIGDDVLARLSLDFTSADTRVRLVDPT